jgi:hypothetical protein
VKKFKKKNLENQKRRKEARNGKKTKLTMKLIAIL